MNIAKNILEIRKQKGITQEVIAEAMGLDTAVISNIEKGKRELKVCELEKISKALDVDLLFLITYPDKYEKVEKKQEDVEAVLQIRLQSSKKDQVLKLLFGKDDLEILR
jgi:transcriptional regulator with XRE-family HTH domain